MFVLSMLIFDFWLGEGLGLLMHGVETGFVEPMPFYLLYLLIGACLAVCGCYTAFAGRPEGSSDFLSRLGTVFVFSAMFFSVIAYFQEEAAMSLRLLAAAVACCYNGSLFLARAGEVCLPDFLRKKAVRESVTPVVTEEEETALKNLMEKLETYPEEMLREIRKTEIFLRRHPALDPEFAGNLRTVRQFVMETAEEGAGRVSPYLNRESARLLETYRRVASHSVKTDKTFEVLSTIEDAWAKLAVASRNLYDTSMDMLLDSLAVDTRVLLFKCATEGLLECGIEEKPLPVYESGSGAEKAIPEGIRVRGLEDPKLLP